MGILVSLHFLLGLGLTIGHLLLHPSCTSLLKISLSHILSVKNVNASIGIYRLGQEPFLILVS